MEQMEVGVITQEKKISIHCLGLFQRYGFTEKTLKEERTNKNNYNNNYN